MKKCYFAVLALVLSIFAAPASAQTDEIYDFSGFDTKPLLDLFYQVHQDGRYYPTLEEFEAIYAKAREMLLLSLLL